MQVTKLLQDNKFKINFELGKEIGAGADGQCFELINNDQKVIKLSILTGNFIDEYKYIYQVLEYLKNNPADVYARLYEHGKLLKGYRSTYYGKQPFIIYYYCLEKCFKITEDEKKVFHTILSHEDRKINKNYSDKDLKRILKGLQRGLDFDAEKVIFFCRKLKKTKVRHLDLHHRNIMKDASGSFKLIDFDRMEINNV